VLAIAIFVLQIYLAFRQRQNISYSTQTDLPVIDEYLMIRNLLISIEWMNEEESISDS
jgi:hypothetical protein